MGKSRVGGAERGGERVMMKTRQNIITIACIVLSFVIAIGGWSMTKMLIDIKSDALLSETGITYIDVPSRTENLDNNTDNSIAEQAQRTLTAQEIYEVLYNWEAPGSERAHEPAETQLNMEQAIEAAKSSLMYFVELGIFPADIFESEYEKTNAYLCQNHVSVQGAPFLDPIYSYWTVTLTCERFDATLIINAVSGQIWKANIVISSYTELFGQHDASNIINSFVAYLGLESDDNAGIAIDSYETIAYANIADSMIQAVVNIRTTKPGNVSIVTEVNFYLATQADV